MGVGLVDGLQAAFCRDLGEEHEGPLVQRGQEVGAELERQPEAGQREPQGQPAHQGSVAQGPVEGRRVDPLDDRDEAGLVEGGARGQEPLHQGGHQGEGQHQADGHGRSHRHGQGRVELACDATHGQQGDEDGQDHQHGDEDRCSHLGGGPGEGHAAGFLLLLVQVQPVGEVLHHDHGGIHQEAHGDGEAAEGHGVEAQPGEVQGDGGAEGGQGQHGQHQQGPAQVPEEDHEDDGHEDPAHQQRQGHPVQGAGDKAALVVDHRQAHALREALLQLKHRGADALCHLQRGGGGLLHHPQAHVLVAVMPCQAPAEGRCFPDLGDFAQGHDPLGALHGEPAHLLGGRGEAAHRHEPALVLDLQHPRRHVLMALLQGRHHAIEADSEAADLLGDQRDLEGALLAPQPLHPGHAGEGLEPGPQHLLGVVPQLHGIHLVALQDDFHQLLEAARGTGHQGRTGAGGEAPDHPGQPLSHELSRPPGIRVALEGHHHLDQLGQHRRRHALDPGHAAQGLLGGLGHGQLQLRRGPAGALDEHAEDGQVHVREEVALELGEGEHARQPPGEAEGEHPALVREEEVEPAADQRPMLRGVGRAGLLGQCRVKGEVGALRKVGFSGHDHLPPRAGPASAGTP